MTENYPSPVSATHNPALLPEDMTIQLISHASVVIDCGGIGIWTDPWLVSKAFNNSWKLLPEPTDVHIPYERIQYIWISHEHPDHFNIPTLKQLPDDFKASVTILFQKTNSDKVFEALQKMGFRKFIAMDNKKVMEIEPGVEVYCYQNHFIDSALGVRYKGQVIFNVNDAEIEQDDYAQILADLGQVDVCLNQFSLAGYRGFADRDKFLPKMAKEKLNRMVHNHQGLKARYTLPFASFIYFCCTDNRYINHYMNTPEKVAARFDEASLQYAFLYPGDVWNIGQEYDSTASLQQYAHLIAGLDDLPYDEPPVIPLSEIQAEFKKYSAILRDHYSGLLLRLFPPFTAHISDLNQSVRLDVRKGECEPIALEPSACDIVVYSQPLHFGFKFPFGIETLAVSARFTVQHNYAKWQRFKRLCVMNSADLYLHPKYVIRPQNFRYLVQRLSSSLISQMVSRAQRQKQLMQPQAG